MKQILFTLVSFIFAGSAMSAVIYVNLNASGNNNGSSWQDAYTNLQDAFNNAVDNDSICIATGTYLPIEDQFGDQNPLDPRTMEFRMESKSVSVFGGYTGNETNLEDRDSDANPVILSGDIGVGGDQTDNCYRVLFYSAINDAKIEGVTVTSSYSTVAGGNVGDKAGIVIAGCSNLSVKNCIIEDNSVGNYGGNVISGSNVILENTVFRNNSAQQGGALYVSNSSFEMYSCEISFNSCAQYGGAISLNNIQNGGLYVFSNSIFHNNSSQSTQFGGGAIHSYNISVPVKVINCTFVNNIADAGLGNSINSNLVDYEVYNSIFWTTNTNSHLNLINSSYSFFVNNSIEQGTQAYPQFTDTATYDFTFSGTSSAVDIGDTTGISQYIPNEDFYGNPRFDGNIDAGAFETCLSTVDLNTSLNGFTISSDQNGASYQWIDCSDDSPISGATNQSFTPSQSGDYACIVTNGCITDTTSCVNVTSLGLNEFNNSTVIVYPNPAKNTVHVESEKQIHSITVVDVTGKKLLTTDEKELSVDYLPLGMYFIQVKTADQTVTRKLIKE